MSANFPSWERKIKLLTDCAWKDADVNGAKVDLWLENFRGEKASIEDEVLHAYHLLSSFIFFGRREIDECLRVLFQEKYVYPLVQEMKSTTSNVATIESSLCRFLENKTRFVGVGDPSESGSGLLYQFRTANTLPVGVFTALERLLSYHPVNGYCLNPYSSDVSHLIFLDDLCGTGDQVQKRLGRYLKDLKKNHPTLQIKYFVLFSTKEGLANAKLCGLFDSVESVISFDEDYKAFEDKSLLYTEKNPEYPVNKDMAKEIMEHYGKKICTSSYGAKMGLSEKDSLGYQNCQLSVGFHHNTPDNSLPTFWASESSLPWFPVFKRHPKF